MSFDGIFTHKMLDELQFLVNGRVHKIQQPYDQEIILTIRSERKNHPLLLSANANYARMQVTNIPFENPEQPPNFCMTLRKYLEGAILVDMKQVENDRIIALTFRHRNEIGDMAQTTLMIELMGRHSNLILLDSSDHKVIACLKHISASKSSRMMYPGVIYHYPETQIKANPFKIEARQLASLFSETEQVTAKNMQQKLQGIGTDTANELVVRMYDKAHLSSGWQSFWQSFTSEKPTLTTNKEAGKTFFTPMPFQSLAGEQKHFDTLSALLDTYYGQKAEHDRTKQQSGEMIHFLKNRYQRSEHKLTKLQETLAATAHADIYRVKGEILTTYLFQIEKGMKTITLPNFYQNDEPIDIELDIRKTPNQNAQNYFHQYQKLKNAVAHVNEQIAATTEEANYLSSVLTQIDLASPKDIAEIREELVQEGYLKNKQKHKKNKKTVISQPENFLSSDGTAILVGKNNLQNDQLTLKMAKKTDYWLHTKNIPGSHVIIKSDDPSEQTLAEAAELAAYYSKSRLSASVPVDYVQVKQIRKPNGAKPGFVIYEGQKTLYVTPHEENIEKMRVT